MVEEPPTRPKIVRRIVIVGAGIVGSALSSHLSSRTSDEIVVLDRSLSPQLGSTGHAPGFVGQLNENSRLTALAKESVQAYHDIPGGFHTCGGLEVATTTHSMENLRSRVKLAQQSKLPASILTAEECAVGGLYFPNDGAANATRVTEGFQTHAQAHGVRFLQAQITRVALSSTGEVTCVETSQGPPIKCSTLVLATGIWTSALVETLHLNLSIPVPILPVAHPYMYSQKRPPRKQASPFIRWPESQIYARDQGSFDGLGSYNHTPAPVRDADMAASPTALVPKLPPSFIAALNTAATHLPDPQVFANPTSTTVPHKEGPSNADQAPAINGIFAVTPDNLPLLGPVTAVPGLYLAAAIWVTHAAGCARVLADQITGTAADAVHEVADAEILATLRPERFAGQDVSVLREMALNNYNHIYKSSV